MTTQSGIAKSIASNDLTSSTGIKTSDRSSNTSEYNMSGDVPQEALLSAQDNATVNTPDEQIMQDSNAYVTPEDVTATIPSEPVDYTFKSREDTIHNIGLMVSKGATVDDIPPSELRAMGGVDNLAVIVAENMGYDAPDIIKQLGINYDSRVGAYERFQTGLASTLVNIANGGGKLLGMQTPIVSAMADILSKESETNSKLVKLTVPPKHLKDIKVMASMSEATSWFSDEEVTVKTPKESIDFATSLGKASPFLPVGITIGAPAEALALLGDSKATWTDAVLMASAHIPLAELSKFVKSTYTNKLSRVNNESSMVQRDVKVHNNNVSKEDRELYFDKQHITDDVVTTAGDDATTTVVQNILDRYESKNMFTDYKDYKILEFMLKGTKQRDWSSSTLLKQMQVNQPLQEFKAVNGDMTKFLDKVKANKKLYNDMGYKELVKLAETPEAKREFLATKTTTAIVSGVLKMTQQSTSFTVDAKRGMLNNLFNELLNFANAGKIIVGKGLLNDIPIKPITSPVNKPLILKDY